MKEIEVIQLLRQKWFGNGNEVWDRSESADGHENGGVGRDEGGVGDWLESGSACGNKVGVEGQAIKCGKEGDLRDGSESGDTVAWYLLIYCLHLFLSVGFNTEQWKESRL